MSEIWYKVCQYDLKIEEVEVVKETKKQIVYKSKIGDEYKYRSAKESQNDHFFKTEKEAVAEKIKQLHEDEEFYRNRYERAKRSKRDFQHKYFDKYSDVV